MYHIYINHNGEFIHEDERCFKSSADLSLRRLLDEHYPGGWELACNGEQLVFKGSLLGNKIAGYVSKEMPMEVVKREREFWWESRERKREQEATGCSFYGVAIERQICRDAYLIASLEPTIEELKEDFGSLFERFEAAGGHGGYHSGNTWGMVRTAAWYIMNGYPPFGKEVDYLSDIVAEHS